MLQFLRRIYSKLLGPNRLSLLITKELTGKCRVLDAGCGRYSPLRLVESGSYKVGLDFHKPYILRSKISSIHNDYALGDVRILPFKPNSFDYAIATELLEHLEKYEGLRMIAELEKVARRVILTTPNGFLPTYPGPDDNPDESHLSGWTVGELKQLGFKVYGLNGLKLFWKIKLGQVVFRSPKIIVALLAGVSELLVYYYPSLALTLFCVKDIEEKPLKLPREL